MEHLEKRHRIMPLFQMLLISSTLFCSGNLLGGKLPAASCRTLVRAGKLPVPCSRWQFALTEKKPIAVFTIFRS